MTDILIRGMKMPEGCTTCKLKCIDETNTSSVYCPLVGYRNIPAEVLQFGEKWELCPIVEPPPQWIPVTERLPEEGCNVLGYYGFNHGDGHLGMMFMQVLDYYAHDQQPHFEHAGTNGMTVTHWMPLPEPPKEE